MIDYYEIASYLTAGIGALIFIATYTSLHNSKFNLKELFIPHLRKKNINSEIIIVLSNPIFWIFAIMIYSLFIYVTITFSKITALEWITFSVVISIFFGLLDSFFIWFLEGKYREPLRYVIGSLIYGGMAGLTAFFINTNLNITLQLLSNISSIGIFVLAIAPLVEETLKLMGVYLFSTSEKFRGMIDGIIIGFSVGVGFAILENLFYIFSKIESYDLNLLLFRVIWNTMAHGAFTAMGGAIIGKIKQDFNRASLKLIAIPIFVAVLIHSAFNILAISDIIANKNVIMGYYIFTPLLDIGLLAAIIFMVINASKDLKYYWSKY